MSSDISDGLVLMRFYGLHHKYFWLRLEAIPMWSQDAVKVAFYEAAMDALKAMGLTDLIGDPSDVESTGGTQQ